MKQSVLFLLIILILAPLNTGKLAQGSEAVMGSPADLSELTVLDLNTAATTALKQNPSMAAALTRVEQALARLTQARSAYWPYLDANASYTRLEASDRSHESNLAMARLFDPLATIDNPDDYYQTGLTATWVLFNGFERKYMNQAAELGQEQSESLKNDVKRLILSSVAETYFAAQLVSENMIIRRADKAFHERLLKEARARSQIGAGSLSDEMNFEIRANTAQAQLLREESTYANALTALAAIMGLPDAAFPEHLKLVSLEAASRDNTKIEDIKGLIDSALSNRPDMNAARIVLQTAESGVKQARAPFYPDVTLYASVDGDRTGDHSFDSDDFGQSAGVNISFNLFSGGADRAKLMEAKAKQREAEKILEQTKLNIISEVKRTTEKVSLAAKELDIQRSIAALVQKNRNLVEKEYFAGQASLVRMNEAQRDLTEAQSRLALAVVSLHQAQFNMQTVTGEILKRY